MANLNVSCVSDGTLNMAGLSSHWRAPDNPSYAGVAGTTTLFLVFAVGVPLNLYLLAAISWKKLYEQPTYVLLLNLGAADLLTCLVPVLLGFVTGVRREISFGASDFVRCQVCKVSAAYVLLTFAQSFTILFLSLERFLFFLAPLRHRRITLVHTKMAVLIIWLMALVLTLPPLFGYGDLIFAMWCGYVFISHPHVRRSVGYLIVCALLGVAVLSLLVISNLWIVCISVRLVSRVKGHRITPHPSQANRVILSDVMTRNPSTCSPLRGSNVAVGSVRRSRNNSDVLFVRREEAELERERQGNEERVQQGWQQEQQDEQRMQQERQEQQQNEERKQLVEEEEQLAEGKEEQQEQQQQQQLPSLKVSQASFNTVHQRLRKAAHRRRLSKVVAQQQLRLFQVFGSILIVNFITVFPGILLVVTSTVASQEIPREFVTFALIMQLLQVILHPIVETFVSPDLRRIVFSHCSCSTRLLRNTRVGRALYAGYRRLSKFYRAELWTKAVEKNLLTLLETEKAAAV